MPILTIKTLFATFFIVFLVTFPVRGQEVDDESGFSYDEESPLGPSNWGNIRPEWKICNVGKMQSPIDLLDERVEIVSFLGRLRRHYKQSNATLINRGHDIMLRWVNGAGNISINGTMYQLNQLHWHSPTEHSIDGQRFDLEVHFVHESPDGRVAVVGIMYKIGRPDSFLSTMEEELKALVNTTNVEKSVGIVDPKQVKIGSRKYYRYIGSLTIPPCTQDVLWTIVRKIRTVSKDQLNLIRQAVHDNSEVNARPTQPLNKRPVLLYRPHDPEEN